MSTLRQKYKAEEMALRNAVQRCHNPKNARYQDYGGRGIKVCDEWRGRGGFEKFLEHIGPKPSPDLTLERIDNGRHYEINNVAWVSRKAQMNNTRRSGTVGGTPLDDSPHVRTAEEPLGDGLYLYTRANGLKSYLWRGRVNGKPATKRIRHPQTGSIATTENITRTEARVLAKQIAAEAARGGGGRFFPEGESDEGVTVSEAWKLYWNREGKLKKGREKVAVWENIIQPAWGSRPLTSITKKDCSDLIEGVLAAALRKGEKGTAANNLHRTLKRFFSWCADEGDSATGLVASPMVAKRKKPIATKPRKRALDERELVWLFQALEAYRNAPAKRGSGPQRQRDADAIETLLRSMCRRSEIFGAQWDWLSPDGLNIPATHTKNGKPVCLPLSPAMLALIGTKPDDADATAPIFGVVVRRLATVFEAAVRPTMTEIAAKGGFNGDFGDDTDPAHWSLHDMRDTAKTWLQAQLRPDDHEPMFSQQTQEACLNHREQGVGAIYNASLDSPYWFFPQRKRAVEAWSEYLDTVKLKALQPVAIAA